MNSEIIAALYQLVADEQQPSETIVDTLKRIKAERDVCIEELKMFIEVEQTSRPDHIAGKYEKYTRYFQTQNLRRCWLVVVFPDRRVEKLLRREHEAAAQAAANALPGDYNLFWATLSELRDKRVTTFDNPVERHSDNTWRQIGTGFLECTYGFLPW